MHDEDASTTGRRGPARRRTRIAVAVTGALMVTGVVTGAVAASASTTSTTAPTTTPTTKPSTGPNGDHDGDHGRGAGHGRGDDHGSASVRGDEKAVSTTQAATLKAEALKAVPGATVYRIETDAGDGSFEAHMTKADGTEVTVKFDKSLAVTKVETGMGTGDPAPEGAPLDGRPGMGGPNHDGTHAAPSPQASASSSTNG